MDYTKMQGYLTPIGHYIVVLLGTGGKRSELCYKTTRCFEENDTLFWRKRHIVLKKTTRCFEENDTLFWGKRHVVLEKTTRCFPRGRKIIGQSSENVFFTMRFTAKLWHLWQQKTQTAVGCARRCVHAYAHTHARGEQIHSALPFFLDWAHA